MELLRELIPVVLAGSLFAIVMAVGLDAELQDLLSLLSRPARLLKAILAVNVLVPLAALLLITLVPISHAAKAGILVMAISPVPPLVPGKVPSEAGRRTYGYGLYTALVLLAVVIVPASVAVMSAIFRHEVALPPFAVARSVAVQVLLPLAIGVMLRRLAPRRAARASKIVHTIAMALLALAAIPLLVKEWPAFVALTGDGVLIIMALVSIAALAAGHLLGGPDDQERAALAVTAATRHPGLALLIVKSNDNDAHVIAAVMVFLLVGTLVSLPYAMMMKRRLAA